MDRRVYGVETEFGVMMPGSSPGEVVRRMFDQLELPQRSSSTFLFNGARLYLDIGDHPEYATAECDSVVDLIAHDKAGERVLEGMATAAELSFREEGMSGDLHVYKNNTDFGVMTYGCHENYLISRQTDWNQLTALLLPFLVTRQMCVGAGNVLLPSAGGPGYSFSQRARHIEQAVASESTRVRPMINTRDEPHADAQEYRRLHVIVGDSNMSETTMMLKIVSTDLVLRLAESGVRLPHLELADPVAAIVKVSTDLRGTGLLDMADGNRLTPLAIQREYWTRCGAEARRSGLYARDPLVRRSLELWGRTLTAVETGDRSLISRDIDWAIKLDFLERYRQRHHLGPSAPRLAQLDMAYHDINRLRGLYYLLESRGAVNRVVKDLAIFQAKSVPPQGTRARLRGEFLRDAHTYLRRGRSKATASANWTHFTLDRGEGSGSTVVLCSDPLRSQDSRIDALRERMRH